MAYDVHDACKVVLLEPGSESTGGTVLNQSDYTEDSGGSPVALDGSEGQVMFRVPKFHYNFDLNVATHDWRIGLNPFSGSTVFPSFTKAGSEVDFRYVGVYPGVLYDDSASATVDGNGNNDNTANVDTANDKLYSVSGKKPYSGLTRAEFRSIAANTGSNWSMVDFWGYAMLKFLYITRYVDLDSQTILGQGNTRFASFDYATCISNTGKVTSKSAAGQSTANGNSGDYVNFLGIEDIFGGLWEFIDGWNVNDRQSYVCQNPAQFADDTTTNYSSYGDAMPITNGYQDTLQDDVAMLPAQVGATSSAKVTDYYWQNTGWRIVRAGGDAISGVPGGLLALSASYSSTTSLSGLGARLYY